MAKKKPESFFWTSYSDLMTSMFFVMLVLFVLTVALLQKKMGEIIVINEQLELKIAKGEEIEKSIEKIDSNYFDYNEEYKRHTLKNVKATFRTQSADINDISPEDRKTLKEAGWAIRDMLQKASDSIPEARYLVIIEGQTSKDGYALNYELSYSRALSLVKFWSRIPEEEGGPITFDDLPCEVIISGSGQASQFREQPDIPGNKENQRFVIHIIPKPGMLYNATKD